MEKWMLFIISIIFDAFYEYPNFAHPTVWVGKIIVYFDKKYKRKGNYYDFIIGSLVTIFAYSVAALIGYAVCKTLVFGLFGAILYVFFLKSTFSVGLLVKKVHACSVDDEEVLKKNVSEIVSRNVNIGKQYLYSAAIESGAENLVDSVVSPLFYFLIFGLPGAMVYRAINTADNLIGYTDVNYKKFGKFAALVDYTANYFPARLFLLVEYLIYRSGIIKDIKIKKGLRINGKYPMLLFAKILNVRLVKKGYYVIGSGKLPDLNDVKKATLYLILISYVFILIIFILSYVYSLPRWC
ncbi:MAG: adenosylcobinamide-phosphate synthase CbiB [Nitrososphaeria archaeon]